MDSELLLRRLSALADKSRFKILQIMAKGTIATCCDRIEAYEKGCCVADVVTVTGLSQPTVSHHLKNLEQVGLIHKEIRGPWTCYFPNSGAMNELIAGLKAELYSSTPCNVHAEGECC
ncbi:helix-turn-helix domain-containing protein [Alicyclobacillus tolerans]|uniref:ArsR/SmtB family transcription factor n=1 Tax=Alicyclobacillus tolerans TaxID=90970 RepID=UPI003558BDD0|nr:helix-turn-helix domain-containing protein [Alicyclobacillus tolerans]